MNQVYLLLRNNEQSGPYVFDDLAMLQLTEKDLIKIAGSNSGWFHPYELGIPFTLSGRIHQPEQPSNTSARAHPPAPAATVPEEPVTGDVDQTIEELSKKITTIRNNLKLVEVQMQAEKQQKVSEKRTRKKPVRYIVALVVVILIVSAAMYMVLRKAPAAQAGGQLSNQPSNISAPAMEPVATYDETSLPFSPADSSAAASGKHAQQPLIKASASNRRRRHTDNKKSNEPVLTKHETTSLSPEKIADQNKIAFQYVTAEEERKTLLQKLAALFKKKEVPVNPNSNPITEESFSDKVKVTISTTNYHWLKGVQGLTLSMLNTSSQTIRRASVNVVYYNKDSGVIERSPIQFSHIKPGKTQSVAAPDHPWAHHAGYEVTAVSVVRN